MAGHFEMLLEDLLEHPEIPVGELSLLTKRRPSKSSRIGIRQPRRTRPTGASHQEFERHARLQPDAPAIVAEGGPLSYGELNDRSDGWPSICVAKVLGRDRGWHCAWIVPWR